MPAEPPVDSSVPEAAEPTIEVARKGPPVELLVEDFGPSDASAVPELSAPLRSEAWEPAIVVNYPIEPSEDDGVEVPEGSDDPGRPEAPVAREDRRDEAAALRAVPFGRRAGGRRGRAGRRSRGDGRSGVEPREQRAGGPAAPPRRARAADARRRFRSRLGANAPRCRAGTRSSSAGRRSRSTPGSRWHQPRSPGKGATRLGGPLLSPAVLTVGRVREWARWRAAGRGR